MLVRDYGVIETDSKLEDSLRLLEIETALLKLLRDTPIDYCCIESVYLGKDLTTGTRLLQARGVILLVMAKLNIPYKEITPLSLKKMITGYGKADKPQMQSVVKKILGLQEIPKPDDAADGLCLAISAWISNKSRQTKLR